MTQPDPSLNNKQVHSAKNSCPEVQVYSHTQMITQINKDANRETPAHNLRTHQAALEAHQPTLSKSAIVGWGKKNILSLFNI